MAGLILGVVAIGLGIYGIVVVQQAVDEINRNLNDL